MQFFSTEDANLRLYNTVIYITRYGVREYHHMTDLDYEHLLFHTVRLKPNEDGSLSSDEINLQTTTIPPQDIPLGFCRPDDETLIYYSRFSTRGAQMGLSDRNLVSFVANQSDHSLLSFRQAIRSRPFMDMLNGVTDSISEIGTLDRTAYVLSKNYAVEQVMLDGYVLYFKRDKVGEFHPDHGFRMYPQYVYLKESVERMIDSKGELDYEVQVAA